MKVNPCYQCVCVPVCGQKFWIDCIAECSLLLEVYKYSLSKRAGHGVQILMIDPLRSKKFFKQKFVGPA